MKSDFGWRDRCRFGCLSAVASPDKLFQGNLQKPKQWDENPRKTLSQLIYSSVIIQKSWGAPKIISFSANHEGSQNINAFFFYNCNNNKL